ncbi:hypothetical protein Q767_15770 [Flavobacterium enshiense DK69]|uniref:Uncharacterized protein n=1 Tax=Flavobacterium enshiense DK69 TaxID=1107311 RepID=A0A0A2MK96_9FLAO|nr:hypothetical protein Q767_15770 [Flavobacterium enshiense DK69]
MLGPTYLDNLTENISNPNDLESHEWRRKLKAKSGETKFRIAYYGKLHDEYKSLIVGTDFAPILIYAINISTKEQILLFDGCKHGYNAMFCDKYSKNQIENRKAEILYKDKNNNEVFEIIISTYNGIEYDDEFGDDVDENGFIELIDGSKSEFDKVKRNGFDTLQINLINGNDEIIEIVSEELS